MKRISFAVAALLITMVAVTGCKKQEQCATSDTPAVCKGVQECFKSGTAIEVCREAERDANKTTNSLAPATNGTGDALSYDPSKASQKAAPKQSTKQ